jgi:peptidoglycan/xylan/chitin deacetylase (PgdA/CDA1 family)
MTTSRGIYNYLAVLIIGLADSAAAENPNPATGTPAPSTLLEMWSPAELIGKPGDERITPLREPDFNPPQQTQPSSHLSQLTPTLLNSIRRVHPPKGRKWVALTFDLCERADEIAGYDRQIVNTLREKKAKATFFAGGKWMQSHPDKTMQLMADPLFEIGNHGWTHGNLRVLTGQRMLDQILWTQAEYENIRSGLDEKAKSLGLENQMQRIPLQPATLRFPYGTCSEESLHATNELGLSAVQWDVVSGDPGGIASTRKIIREIRPGSIVVFHANGRGQGTAAALPKIIDGLRAQGFEFLTVSDMLGTGIPESANSCYELRPGDNQRYGAWFGEGMITPGKRAVRKSPKIEAQQARRQGL